jgi:hypothetical protein
MERTLRRKEERIWHEKNEESLLLIELVQMRKEHKEERDLTPIELMP